MVYLKKNNGKVIAVELKRKALFVVDALERAYPGARCSLTYATALQLLIATRLSAQCTDARVNLVTKDLFARFDTAAAFADADLADIEALIHSCGLYKTKARDIKGMCAALLERHGGEVPDTMEALTALPGVGRKTANLILGDVFGKPAVVVDTHCLRLSNRLGLAQGKDPLKVETQLRAVIPPEKSAVFCHRLVLHGREVCRARGPLCEKCVLRWVCDDLASRQAGAARE